MKLSVTKIVIISLFLLGLPVPGFTLDPKKPIDSYLHEAWNSENGLPQNGVMAIRQTRDGYLWMGTQEGLARFNGQSFEVFDQYNTKEITNNYIRVLKEDRQGTLWIGTDGGGVVVLKNGSFSNASKGTELAESQVSAICQLRDDSILIGTRGKGVYMARDGVISPFALPTDVSHSYIMAIYQDSYGNTWIGTDGKGLIKKNGNNNEFTIYTMQEGLPCNQIKVIFADTQGNLLIGTAAGGLCFFDYKKNTFKTFDTSHGLPDNNITALCEDKQGNLWIGTLSGGICRFRDGIFSTYNARDGLTSNSVAALYEDRERSLWIGTDGGGLERLRDKNFTVLDTESGLSNDMVYAILEANDGDMYISTKGGGVNRLSKNKITVYDTSTGLSHNTAYALYQDSDDTLWIGTYGGGLNALRNGKVKVLTTKDGLSSNFIWSMTGDRLGALWIGTDGGGLNRFKDGTFTVFNTQNGLSNNRISVIREDSQGELWVGTFGGGLNRIKNGKITIYNTSSGLSSNQVLSLYKDNNGALWIGTYGGGLNHFKNGIFTPIMIKNGLFDNVVYQILEDYEGYFWMSCNKGIFRVPGQKLRDFVAGKTIVVPCSSYGKADGMKRVECNGGCQPAGVKTADGKLWFPTLKGAVIIDPVYIHLNTSAPPVVIEAVKVDMQSIDHHRAISLPPGSNNIEIRYAGLSYIAPDQVEYRYILAGFDQRCTDAGNRRTAFYTNLPPGEYRFNVTACNKDGIWNETGATFAFVLGSYFYQTWWFYSGCALGMILIVFGGYRLRVRRLRKRKEELEHLVTQRTCELAEATKEAQKERRAANEANQAKSEFLARMSHEIRTPMNSVIGFTQMLMDTELTDEQFDFIAAINRSGEALVSIINDILDFSKIEAGKLTFEPLDFDPEVMAFDICQLILPRIGSKPLEVLCRIGDAVPAYVRHDPGRFRQVLMNLMSNAEKFTEKGEIELSLEVDEETRDQVQLHARIRDTGIGIPPDKLDSIFEVFQQADGSITRRYGGTGLGLAISRQIARQMGGDIHVDSQTQQGSTFHFTAWVEKSTKKNQETPVIPLGKSLTARRVMVVDDNNTNLDIIQHVLESLGMEVVKLNESKNVITILREYQKKGTPVELVILDIHMPEPDGYEVARQIRSQEPPLANLPLLAFTSSGPKKLNIYRESGFDGFLPKPVQKQKLAAMIERLLVLDSNRLIKRKREQQEVFTQHSLIEEAKQSVKILLAEDNLLNQKLTLFMLSKAGYRVEIVNNGKEAIEKYSAHPEDYDLIFMDIQMPEMDGWNATRRLREKGFVQVPIIAMTAASLKDDIKKCSEAGMNDYISKPIKREIVFEMIKKWVLKDKIS